MRVVSAGLLSALALGGLGATSPIPGSPSPNPGGLDPSRFDSPGNVKSPRPFDTSSFPGRNKVVRQRRPIGRKNGDGFQGLGLAPDRKPVAAPMSRSLARDAGSQEINSEGLGVMDSSQADSIKKSIHDLAAQLAPLGPAGPALVDLVKALGDTVVDMLGPQNPPSKRANSRFMPRQTSSDPPTGETLDAEGLGLVSPATGQQITSGLKSLGDAVSTTVPLVGPIVGNLVNTLGEILGGLISRDLGDDEDCADEGGMQRRGFESFLPPPVYQQASSYFNQGQAAGQGTPAGPTLQEFVGPDGRVYEAFEPGSAVAQSFGQKAQLPNVIGQIPSFAGAAQNFNPSSFPSTAQDSVSGTAGAATQFISSTQDDGLSAESFSGGAGELIGYLSNGLPVFASLQGPLQGITGTVGRLANTVGGAVGGVVSNSPIGGLINSGGNSPLSGVLGTVGNLPVVGGILGSGGGGLFGVLDASPSGTASASLATITATSTDASTASPMPTISSYPQPAEGKDATDDNDPSTLGAQEEGDDDASPTSASMTPYTTATSTWGPSDGASSTPTPTTSAGADSTMAEPTPTPSLPPQ